MKSELCKSCTHKKVCGKDKNTVGDVFVLGHPFFFDNSELFRKFQEREAAGFPCDDYLPEQKLKQGGGRTSNADRIRGMGEEDMAEFISEGYYSPHCPHPHCPQPSRDTDGCRECWLDWLRSKVDE